MLRRLVPLVCLALVLGLATGPAPASAGPPMSWGPEFTYHPATAGATYLRTRILWSNGSATTTITTTGRSGHLVFEARTDHCDGPARVEVRVDGVHLLTQDVAHRGSYAVPGDWPAGRHHVSFRFTNDVVTTHCDRNLKIDHVSFNRVGLDVDDAPVWQSVDLESATVSPVSAGGVVPTPGWYGSPAVKLWSNGTMRAELDSLGGTALEVRLTSWPCHESARVAVRVDGETVHTDPHRLSGTVETRTVRVHRAFGDGVHAVEVELLNDAHEPTVPDCDIGVRVDDVMFTGTV